MDKEELIDQQETAEIFLWKARFLFGLILQDFIESVGTSQSKLGERAVEHDKYLKAKKFRYPDSTEGFPGRTGISRLVNARRPPTYGQIYIIFHVLKQYFDEIGEDFSEDLQDDLWHLALFGSPREVRKAYDKYKDLIKEDSPEFIKAREEHMRKMGEI